MKGVEQEKKCDAEKRDYIDDSEEEDEILYIPPISKYITKVDNRILWSNFLDKHKTDNRWSLKQDNWTHNVSNKRFDKKCLNTISFKNEYLKSG